MGLHHDGHTHIYKDDALSPLRAIADHHRDERFRPGQDADSVYSKPVAESFDAIVTNPPFSITLDASTTAALTDAFDLAGTTNSENLFLERWYQLLVHGGRLAAVLPESFFSTAENLPARLFLLAHFDIKAIVSLPPTAFQPWTPTRTSLLFAQKKRPKAEAMWKAAFQAHLAAVERDLRDAKRHLSHLRRLSRRESGESLAARRQDLTRLIDVLAMEIEVEEIEHEEGLSGLQRMLSGCHPESIALQRTVEEVGGDASYTGIVVESVGYRRTRRGETERPNDLFQAVSSREGEPRSIRNLNDMSSSWEIDTTGDGADALSHILSSIKWD
jgi:type I restriction enzyme M protein